MVSQLLCTVIWQRQVAEGYFELCFEWPSQIAAPLAGQFFTLRASHTFTPLLRRPFAFSAYDSNTGQARCIYQRRGPATQLMGKLDAGDSIDILAPLGGGFPWQDNIAAAHGPALLIAGGVGMGPIFFLATSMRRAGHNPHVILGARSANLIPSAFLEDLCQGQVLLCSDDGSVGIHGSVVDVMNNLDLDSSGNWYSCGPNAMMKAIHRHAVLQGLLDNRQHFVSMEQTMGCAVGACMGCVVPVYGEPSYARVCSEGPVFAGSSIRWEDLNE